MPEKNKNTEELAGLSAADREKLAEQIVDKFMARVYREIGQSVASKLFWVGIAAAIAIAVSMGLIKIPTGAP